MIRSLRDQVTLWFGITFLVLYMLAGAVVLGVDAGNARRELQILLYAEAEAAATYLATTEALDFPELRELEEHTPIPLWLRVVGPEGVLAATPGTPDLAPARAADGTLEIFEAGGERLARVRHPVWTRPGLAVEAISTSNALARRRHDLLVALALAGLVLIPLAVLGGRVIAGRALRPVDGLVRSIRALDPRRLEARLEIPAGAREIARLAEEFNGLLERLEASVASMRRFTADASHELRTPISVLRTGIEVVLRKPRSAGEYRRVLEENLLEIGRVQRLVEGLLTLAREGAEAGEGAEPRREAVDLGALVATELAAMRPAAEEAGVTLEAEGLEAAPRVLGQAEQLRLVATNLLDNAVKFSPPGGRVLVTVGERGGWVRLVVADQGPGVPAADRGRIFERFFRGRGAGPSGRGAGGLGLSVVQWVVQRHGGRVRLLEGGGRGAVFEVSLPPADAGAEVAPQASPSKSTATMERKSTG